MPFCVARCFSRTESLSSPVFLSFVEVSKPRYFAKTTTCLELAQLIMHCGLVLKPVNKSPWVSIFTNGYLRITWAYVFLTTPK